jgi:hypothetical protein
MTSCQLNARLLYVFILASLGASQAAAFYDPGLGRWITRDPITEVAFLSMSSIMFMTPIREEPAAYTFAGNDPNDNIDWLGLAAVPAAQKCCCKLCWLITSAL